jgi:alkanesulfonate monooxygenase SsuD/methylene tetrahydromethanopterin reductase-like flavin-dependent oxidoreductase (luciferase family)
MWAATGDPRSAAEVGRRGMRHVLVLRGVEGTRRAFAAHRKARALAGLPPVTTDNFAYAAFVYVGDTEEEGRRVGEKLLWFLNTSLKSAPQHSRFMPGTAPPETAPQIYRNGPAPAAAPTLTNAEKGVAPSAGQNARRLMSLNAEEAMAMGILFVGNPDSVYRQIMEFHDKVGGFGHLSMIGRSGFMSHTESEKGIRLFANEVLPRLKEVKAVKAI